MKWATLQNTMSKFKHTLRSACPLVLVLLALPAQASALKQLADANNAVYREIRDLGPLRTPGQIAQVEEKHFAPALKALSDEHSQKWNLWKKEAARIFNGTKEEFRAIFGISGKAAGEKGAAPDGAKPNAEETKAPSGRIGAQTDTGEQAGSDGAKKVGFGGKRSEQGPKIDPNTGLILER